MWADSVCSVKLQVLDLSFLESIDIFPCASLAEYELVWCNAYNWPVLVVECLDPKMRIAICNMLVVYQKGGTGEQWAGEGAQWMQEDVVE